MFNWNPEVPKMCNICLPIINENLRDLITYKNVLHMNNVVFKLLLPHRKTILITTCHYKHSCPTPIYKTIHISLQLGAT